MKQQNGYQAVYAVRYAARLNLQLNAALDALSSMEIQLVPPQVAVANSGAMEIQFEASADMSPRDLANRLTAFASIVDSAVELLETLGEGVGTVRVVHVESGSLSLKTAAALKLLNILGPWLNRAVDYYFRNRTIEGQLLHGAEAAKIGLQQVLDLRAQLAGQGIATTDMDAAIERASKAMAENVGKLIEGQIRFKVDDREFNGASYIPPSLPYAAASLLADERRSSSTGSEGK